jgi:hypothetical protein
MPQGNVKIAVVMDRDGVLREIPHCARVVFYEKAGDAWVELSSVDFSFQGVSGLCGMRKRLFDFMNSIGDEVRAILAAGFPGVSRDVLSRGGYVLYECELFEQGVLEGILEHLENGDDNEELVPTVPYEREPGTGRYYLDMRLALNANPDLTTKKILRPFFQKVKFVELEFIYDHFPPWLPLELSSLGYKYQCSNLKGGVMVRIFEEAEPCART